MSNEENRGCLITVSEVNRFIIDCLVAAGAANSHVGLMADLLSTADRRGHYSHGMNRLDVYINDLYIRSTDGQAVPKILKQTPATAWVDGMNGLGAVVGQFCMRLAIEKAKEIGVGWVCARNSNHYGIAGWYAQLALNEGLIGMSMTNSSPCTSVTGSWDIALGTNPISFFAPGYNGDSFMLDMATSTVALGKVEMKLRTGQPCPNGWVHDSNGETINDPKLAIQEGRLFPLGGQQSTSGYKGYGLGTMVEVLCGISADSNFSTKIRGWSVDGSDTIANLGQVFIAIDPNCFAPGFEERLSELTGILRGMIPVDPNNPVLVAGDPEKNHMAKVDEQGGIWYHENQIQSCNELSMKLNVNKIRIELGE